jgi:hypothetical protein
LHGHNNPWDRYESGVKEKRIVFGIRSFVLVRKAKSKNKCTKSLKYGFNITSLLVKNLTKMTFVLFIALGAICNEPICACQDYY